MKVKIKEGSIVIDPIELLREMKGEERLDLIEALSCEDEVIKNVADQIIHGCTERGWSGGKSFSETPSTPLGKAIREVSINSSDISRQEIERLERLVKSKEELVQNGWDKYHELSKSIHERRGVL